MPFLWGEKILIHQCVQTGCHTICLYSFWYRCLEKSLNPGIFYRALWFSLHRYSGRLVKVTIHLHLDTFMAWTGIMSTPTNTHAKMLMSPCVSHTCSHTDSWSFSCTDAQKTTNIHTVSILNQHKPDFLRNASAKIVEGCVRNIMCRVLQKSVGIRNFLGPGHTVLIGRRISGVLGSTLWNWGAAGYRK